MSGNENRNSELALESLAFEYVSGTLRDQERTEFESQLSWRETLQQAVYFWEDKLMAMHNDEERPPSPKTWEKISARINAHIKGVKHDPQHSGFTRIWQWLIPAFTAALIILAVVGYYPNVSNQYPLTDYVAVLTDDSGHALLTALATKQDKNIWIKWDINKLREGTHAQLWAISKRDGQTRPIAVLESIEVTKVSLDEAVWRLVVDAEFLTLTEEEPGGSTFDEPSDMLLAKGYCVRFSTNGKPI